MADEPGSDKHALPWERADTDTPRAAKVMRDYFEKEAVSADDFERDLYEPMQKFERDVHTLLEFVEEVGEMLGVAPEPRVGYTARILTALAAPSAASSSITIAKAREIVKAAFLQNAMDPRHYALDALECADRASPSSASTSTLRTNIGLEEMARDVEKIARDAGGYNQRLLFEVSDIVRGAASSHATTLVTEAHAAAEVMEFFARNRATVGTQVPSIAELHEWAALLRRLAPASAKLSSDNKEE